jgi:hypothetical protein
LLTGYFDESGTHGNANFTSISGFIGDDTSWSEVEPQWRECLASEGVPYFHYVECKHQHGHYWKWDRRGIRSAKHIDDLAKILFASNVNGVTAGFSGNWSEAVAPDPSWKVRFPKSYNFCFEMCIEGLRHFVSEYWGSEPIALVFARQDQFGKRAEEVWRTFKHNGEWPEIVNFTYAEPESLVPLQCADMIAHETYQYLVGGRTDSVLERLPLLRRLMTRQRLRGCHGSLVGGHYTAEGFAVMMRQPKGRYLKRAPDA